MAAIGAQLDYDWLGTAAKDICGWRENLIPADFSITKLHAKHKFSQIVVMHLDGNKMMNNHQKTHKM